MEHSMITFILLQLKKKTFLYKIRKHLSLMKTHLHDIETSTSEVGVAAVPAIIHLNTV